MKMSFGVSRWILLRAWKTKANKFQEPGKTGKFGKQHEEWNYNFKWILVVGWSSFVVFTAAVVVVAPVEVLLLVIQFSKKSNLPKRQILFQERHQVMKKNWFITNLVKGFKIREKLNIMAQLKRFRLKCDILTF